MGEIKSRLDIATIASEHLQLKKAGANWKGCCPFHSEKTASFIVSPEKQIFHCFGCGEGGNLFSFLMKVEGLSFVEAVEKLAHRAGVQIVKQESKGGVSRDEKQFLARINRFAASYYSKNLHEEQGSKVREYLKKRGVLEETAHKFELGFAPAGYENLVSALKAKNIPLDKAAVLGLIRKRDDGTYFDFFRNRLMFPIISATDQVIGFGGRTMDDTDEQAKYINSSESPLYNKSESIYGFNLAKKSVRQNDAVVLVEGYMDQMMLFQAGIENVVAPLGTALTSMQIRILSRFTKNFTLLFDGDAAGAKAAERSLPNFLKEGLPVKMVDLPSESDPDDFVRQQGAEALLEKIQKARPLLDLIMESITGAAEPTLQGRLEAAKRFFPYLNMLQQDGEKGMYIQRLASFLQTREELVTKELAQFGKKDATFTPHRADERADGRARPGIDEKQLPLLERMILQLVLSGKDVPVSFFSSVEEADFSDRSLQELWRSVSEVGRKDGKVLIAPLVDSLRDDQLGRLAVALSVDLAMEDEDLSQAFVDCEQQLDKRRKQKKLQSLTNEIRLAEEKQDDSKVSQLLGLRNKLMNSKCILQKNSNEEGGQ